MKNWIQRAREKVSKKSSFHLHLISDSTGETLTASGRAAAAQYSNWRAIEHVTPMVRTAEQLKKALGAVEKDPGIILYTIVDEELERQLVAKARQLNVPSLNILTPMTTVFGEFLGDTVSRRMGAQHSMDEVYFGRLEAIKFAIDHDDGNLPDDIEEPDVILVGISRTSKTPTSIYLGQRGLKVANIPLVPGVELPDKVTDLKHPIVVGLVASVERVLQVRENRLMAFDREQSGDAYVDRASIQEELVWTRRLCKQHNWPIIDVSKKSVEEISAAILALRQDAP